MDSADPAEVVADADMTPNYDALRLPSFVTAETVAAKLKWANSVQRQVREALKQRGLSGDVFENLLELLKMPAGGLEVFTVVKAADPQHVRCLSRAVAKSARALAGGRQGAPSSVLEELLSGGHLEEAAWLAFDRLSFLHEGNLEDDEAIELRLLVEGDETLREKLGDYWRDWSARADPIGAPSCADEDEAPSPGAEALGDGLADLWRLELSRLGGLASGAPFDTAVVEALRDVLARLEALTKDRAAQAEAAIARARAASEAAARITTALRRFKTPSPSLDALAALAGSPSSIETSPTEVMELAEWVEAAAEEFKAAEAARQVARERLQQNDDDEASDEFNRCHERQRDLRKSIEVKAACWVARLRAPTRPDERIPRANHEEEARLSEGPHPSLPPEVGVREPVLAGGSDKFGRERAAQVEAPAPLPPEQENRPNTDGPRSEMSDKRLEEEEDASNRVAVIAEPESEHPVASAGTDTPCSPEDDQRIKAVTPSPTPADPVVAEADRLAREAISLGRYGLAAHLARAAEALGAEHTADATSAVLEALAIGEAVDGTRLAQCETRYAALVPSILAACEEPFAHSVATRLLVFAGALRPAIFSVQSAAKEIVRAAEPPIGKDFHALAEFVADELVRRGGTLSFVDLGPEVDQETVTQAEEEVRRQILEEADLAPSKKAVFQRATVIWRHIFADGPVSKAVAALRAKRPDAPELVEAAASWIDRDVEDRVYKLDTQIKRPKDPQMEGKAREWTLTSLESLGRLLRRWLTVSNRAQATRTSHSAETRQILRQLVVKAEAELVAHSLQPELAGALTVAGRALLGLRELLDGAEAGRDQLDLGMLLDDDLLLFPTYPDEALARRLSESGARAFILQSATVVEQEVDYQAAFQRLTEAGRFEEAERVVARLEAEGHDSRPLLEAVDDARLERLDRLDRWVRQLQSKVDDLLGADVEGRIDPAVAVRLDGLASALADSDSDPSEVARRFDFVAREAEMQEIEATLNDEADLLLVPLLDEIERLEREGRSVELLRQFAERRALTTLRESLIAVREGAVLETNGGPDELLSGLGGYFSAGFCGRPAADRNVAGLIEDARGRREGSAVDFSGLGEADAELSAQLLQAWNDLKRASLDETPAALRNILLELRFGSVKITVGKPIQRARRYSVTFDPTSDRRDCPAPAFGSGAHGRMEVIVAEKVGVSNGAELHGLVKALESSSTVPSLVIVKGLLEPEQRRGFMVEARGRASQEPSALLDEAGVIFLATRAGRRRGDFFAVALPGGGTAPYSDASGFTSPEMFFGRSRELDELWSQTGTCLVYGGRQLGKTALLQQVQLRYSRPPTQIVVYGSLQGRTEVWELAGELLEGAGLPVKRRTRASVVAAVDQWLREQPLGRILVLVDEADIYFEAEMEGGRYSTLTQIRDLMQATQRRCKFVFAGLHNVQRLARTPNSPLLHFGAPLNVGPLIGPDLGDARDMVTAPMAATGAVLEDHALANHILSAVGFYPSLVQTFGQTLLSRLSRTASSRLKVDRLLPLVVSSRDVENALEDNNFKQNIRDKFKMTLSLDERYRLITLAMLQRGLELRDQGQVAPPLSDVSIQQLALDWWPQGFEEARSLDAFQGLLQEMVGLGVLIDTGGGYVIRSSRIAAMLGGKEQIERELLAFGALPGPEKLDTGSLRRLNSTDQGPSPLTFRQEGQLMAESGEPVHLVIGSKALGLDDLTASLGDLPEDAFALQAASYATARQFETALYSALNAVRRDRRNLLVLTGPWLGEATAGLCSAVRSSRGSKRALHVVVAPYDVDWRDVDEVDADGRLWGLNLLSLSPLGRSGLRQWLRSRDASDTPESVETLLRVTGGFPLLLSRLGTAKGAEILNRAEAAQSAWLTDAATLPALGLADERLLRAARIIQEYEPTDLARDLADMGVENAECVPAHLARLGILELGVAAGPWALNPFAAAALFATRQSRAA